MRHLIRLESEGQVFYLRIAAVVIHEGRVLLHRADGEGFWSFPGGRAELGESMEAGLKREMLEELQSEVEVVRPLWLIENFFTFREKRFHELCMYFLAALPPGSPLLGMTEPHVSYEETEKGPLRIQFQWFERDALSEVKLVPGCLRAALVILPLHLEYLVHDDGELPGE